jgi:hypothetical protein
MTEISQKCRNSSALLHFSAFVVVDYSSNFSISQFLHFSISLLLYYSIIFSYIFIYFLIFGNEKSETGFKSPILVVAVVVVVVVVFVVVVSFYIFSFLIHSLFSSHIV